MIKLETIEQKDIDIITQWVSNPKEVMLWAGPAYKLETLKDDMIKDFEYAKEYPDRIQMFKPIDTRTNEMIGHVQLFVDKENETAGIGRMIINPDLRGKGLAKQVINEILRFSFNNLNLHLIYLVVFDFNIPAIKSYEKCGFTKEGILKDRRKVGNEFWSLVSMSILKEEYSKL